LARSCFGMTLSLRKAGLPREAAPICRRAIALWEKLSADTQAPNPRRELGNCLMELGQIMYLDRQPDKAEAAYREALRLCEGLVAEHPKYAEGLGHAARYLWFILPWDRSQEKIALLQKAVDVFERLNAEHPDDYLQFEADTRRTLGDVLSTVKRYEEAE